MMSRSAPAPRPDAPHTPVMLREVLDTLAPVDGETYLDATFGAGGYTRAILDRASCKVIATDRDPSAVKSAAPMLEAYAGRLALAQARFGDMRNVVELELGTDAKLNGIVFDLGVSSMQLDQADRGFSFHSDGPLDMRMGHADGTLSEDAGSSAAEVVNSVPQELLADILYQLGEERRSRAISAAIVRRRQERPFERTRELADLVANVPGTRRPDGKHPATRTFQALRIWVNDELGELARGLLAAEDLLTPEGRLVVVTFHSLEDRLVKRFLAERGGRTSSGSRHLPGVAKREPSFRLVNSKALSPGDEEIAQNPRARSARLRWAVRTETAPMVGGASELDLPAVLTGR